MNYKKHVTDRRRNLLASLYVAINEADQKARTKLMLKIKKFNGRYPSIAITNATIRRSYKAKATKANSQTKGLNINEQLKDELAQ